MRDTKNIILGVIGIFICMHVVFMGMNIYSLQTHKNQLNHVVSRAVEHGLEHGFRTEDELEVIAQVEKEIKDSLNKSDNVVVEVKAIDLKKGLLSVEVTEEFSYITGKTKQISQEKTAIMDQKVIREEFVTVQFLVDGEVYKEYQVVPGEACPLPKLPNDTFSGWIQYGTDNTEVVENIEAVWENQVYLAVSD